MRSNVFLRPGARIHAYASVSSSLHAQSESIPFPQQRTTNNDRRRIDAKLRC